MSLLCLQHAEIVAHALFNAGFPYSTSSDVLDNITKGYGKLSENGFWEYQLVLDDNNEPFDWKTFVEFQDEERDFNEMLPKAFIGLSFPPVPGKRLFMEERLYILRQMSNNGDYWFHRADPTGVYVLLPIMPAEKHQNRLAFSWDDWDYFLRVPGRLHEVRIADGQVGLDK